MDKELFENIWEKFETFFRKYIHFIMNSLYFNIHTNQVVIIFYEENLKNDILSAYRLGNNKIYSLLMMLSNNDEEEYSLMRKASKTLLKNFEEIFGFNI